MWFHLLYIWLICQGAFGASGPGTTLLYKYQSHLQVRQGALGVPADSTSRTLSLKITAKLAVTQVWQGSLNQTLLKLHVSDNQVETWYDKEPLKTAPIDFVQSTFLLSFNGNDNQLFSSQEALESLNFERGLASMFLLRQSNEEVEETDALGKCKTKYQQDRHGLHKTKEACQSGQKAMESLFTSQKYSNAKWLYKLHPDTGAIDQLEIREWHEFYPRLTPELSKDIQQLQTLTLLEQVQNEEHLKADSLGEAVQQVSSQLGLPFVPVDIKADSGNIKDPKTKLKNVLVHNKRHLRAKALGSAEAAQAFAKAMAAIASSSKEDVLVVLKDKSYYEILTQLMDVIGASSNSQAHEAAYEVFVNPASASRVDLFERYMFAIAQARFQNPLNDNLLSTFFKDLQKTKFTHDKLRQTLLLTVSKLAAKSEDTTLTVKILKWLIGSLLKCQDYTCYELYLRALKVIKAPSVIPILLTLAESQDTDHKTALLALEVISQYDGRTIEDKVGNIDQHLLTLAKGKDLDMSLRSVSMELLLLLSPNTANAKAILAVLNQERNKEMTALFLQKWSDLAERKPIYKALLATCIGQGWLNWDLLSHGGLSTSFSRVLSQSSAGNSSFTFNLQVSGKLMKRSSFELQFHDDKGQKQSFVELGMFAGGLSSMVGEAVANDDTDANAGMILNVMGHQLRPYVFFSSMGELMSLYMSGASEEKTSALQGNLQLQECDWQFFLTNGIQMRVWNKGSVSYDLSGQAKISMWSKESHSLVENAGSYVMSQGMKMNLLGLDTFRQDTTFGAKFTLDLENNIDFGSDDVQTCIKMSQPPVSITQKTVTKWPSGAGTETSTSKVNLLLNGKTLFLNEKNNELCNRMYPK